ncbi:surface protease GP63, partial [Trypanosoma conorhini]
MALVSSKLLQVLTYIYISSRLRSYIFFLFVLPFPASSSRLPQTRHLRLPPSTTDQHRHFSHAMRRPLRAALPLLLLLLATTCCAGGCLAAAHRRALDEAAMKSGPPPTAMVREVPRKGEGAAQAYTVAAAGEGKEWEPIRIVVSMEDLSDASKY